MCVMRLLLSVRLQANAIASYLSKIGPVTTGRVNGLLTTYQSLTRSTLICFMLISLIYPSYLMNMDLLSMYVNSDSNIFLG